MNSKAFRSAVPVLAGECHVAAGLHVVADRDHIQRRGIRRSIAVGKFWNHGTRLALCEISCGILPLALWYLAMKSMPARRGSEIARGGQRETKSKTYRARRTRRSRDDRRLWTGHNQPPGPCPAADSRTSPWAMLSATSRRRAAVPCRADRALRCGADNRDNAFQLRSAELRRRQQVAIGGQGLIARLHRSRQGEHRCARHRERSQA